MSSDPVIEWLSYVLWSSNYVGSQATESKNLLFLSVFELQVLPALSSCASPDWLFQIFKVKMRRCGTLPSIIYTLKTWLVYSFTDREVLIVIPILSTLWRGWFDLRASSGVVRLWGSFFPWYFSFTLRSLIVRFVGYLWEAMPSSLLLWGLVSLATRAFSIPTVYISGSKFFLRDTAQTQFFIKGARCWNQTQRTPSDFYRRYISTWR